MFDTNKWSPFTMGDISQMWTQLPSKMSELHKLSLDGDDVFEMWIYVPGVAHVFDR